jgi:hypothetical protein
VRVLDLILLVPVAVVVRLTIRRRQILRVRSFALRVAALQILVLGRVSLYSLIRRFVGPRVGYLLTVPRVHVGTLVVIVLVQRPGIPLRYDNGGGPGAGLGSLPPGRGACGERRERADDSQDLHRVLEAHRPSRAKSVTVCATQPLDTARADVFAA